MLHYCYLKGLSLQHWTYVGVKWNGFNLFLKGFYCETFAGRPYATTAVQNYIFPHPYLEIGLCLCQLFLGGKSTGFLYFLYLYLHCQILYK